MKENNFKILSYKEESLLDIEDLKKYYQSLKAYLVSKKFNVAKSTYLHICESLNYKKVRKVIDTKKGYDLYIYGIENIPSGPVIFASTHQDYNDHFNVVLSIPEHIIILNTKNVTLKFKLLMAVNGIVYVDRTSDLSRFNSKIELMHYLAQNKSVVVFPEATFNCSPNKLHLPLHKGVVDIAKKMQVPIVPLIQEYTYDEQDATIKNVISCDVAFGKPIYVSYQDSKDEKINELSAAFSTIRWNLIEKKGDFQRVNISIQEYINYVLSRIDGWSKTKVSIDDERQMIYGVSDDFYLFHHANDIPFDEHGLLPTQEVIKLNAIYSKNLSNICLDRDGNIINADDVLSLARKKPYKKIATESR